MSDSSQREEAIFTAAIQLPTGERAAFLQDACGGDTQLLARVADLLRTMEQTVGPDKTRVVSVPLTEKPGDKIGRYKLLEQIGEGGFGVVYVAEQEVPVRRRVALKVIKMGMDTKQVIARFEAERQALALMDHPNIAKVLDAGATETGRPYFVMELVKGERITDYCDKNNLSTRERLDLFVQICHAIQHAHQKGIIHRDIKPSNILVTLHDGMPVPKVIDFGIAKATEQRLTDKTVYTALEQMIGTPAYMSPEQAEMSGLDIDTRSDIYSLGVLLYELLTGKTPFDGHELVASGLEAMRRTIREQEPQRPSTRLTTMMEGELTATAKHRQTDPPKLVHSVRGDLDWIAMKCLEKDRTRRYETANGVAADILRHLLNEAVLARPPSQIYRFQKLVRRNKLVCAAAGAVALALMVGLGISTWMYLQARANERKAQAEAAKSQQVAQFLKDMLNGVGPSVALGRDTTMLRDILDKTAESVGKYLNEQPDVGADMRTTIGEVYYALAEYAKAEAMEREAVSIRRKLLGNDNLELAQSLDDLGVALQKQRKAEEAVSMHREALAIRRKLLGNEHPDVAKSLSHLGDALDTAGKYEEAESTLREAVTIQQKLKENLDLAQSLTILANILNWRDKRSEAETVARESLAITRLLPGKEHPEVAGSLQILGNTLSGERKFAEAEAPYREALELRMRLLGNQHPLVGQSLGNLIVCLNKEGKQAEVVSVYRKLADQGNADAQGHLGWMYAQGTGVTRDPVEAFNLCRKSAEQGDANGQSNLGFLYENGWGVEKDLAEALKWYCKAAERGDSEALNLHVFTFLWHGLGDETGRAEAVRVYRKMAAEGYPNAQTHLGMLYEYGWGVKQDLAEALKWYRKAAEKGNAEGQSHLGWSYANGWGVEKDLAEAAKWYRKAAEKGMATAQNTLGWMYQNGRGVGKDYAEALKWYRQAAAQGNISAQYRLARMYQHGEGVPKDDSESARFFAAIEEKDAQALNDFAWMLATSASAEMRDGTNAVRYAEKAVAATQRKNGEFLDTLAAAYAETQQFDKAVATQQEAMGLLQTEQEKKDFASRLKLYQANSPYRE